MQCYSTAIHVNSSDSENDQRCQIVGVEPVGAAERRARRRGSRWEKIETSRGERDSGRRRAERVSIHSTALGDALQVALDNALPQTRTTLKFTLTFSCSKPSARRPERCKDSQLD